MKHLIMIEQNKHDKKRVVHTIASSGDHATDKKTTSNLSADLEMDNLRYIKQRAVILSLNPEAFGKMKIELLIQYNKL